MRKYTREQVKAMTQEEYESLICKELNEAGFRSDFQGESYEYQPDDSTFGGDIVLDANAVDYLKLIGLVDNGKCPLCSLNEDQLEFKLQNQHSGAVFHVCKSCYKQYAPQERAKRGCGCCLVIIVMVALIIWGIMKLIS